MDQQSNAVYIRFHLPIWKMFSVKIHLPHINEKTAPAMHLFQTGLNLHYRRFEIKILTIKNDGTCTSEHSSNGN